jgi:hypothetical protein
LGRIHREDWNVECGLIYRGTVPDRMEKAAVLRLGRQEKKEKEEGSSPVERRRVKRKK